MARQFDACVSSQYSSQNRRSRYNDTYGSQFSGDSFLELCNSFWTRVPSARKDIQPYLRGCKWSPDGTCCLCVVNYDGFHLMELPRDLYEGCPTRDRMITLLPAVIHVKDTGIVYDFCWYPKMNSQDPVTCSWISTKINSPIQMWDAYDGSLRCSYRGFNAVDEMEPAISVVFINQGQRIVGGYKNCLRTFDVERPGREFLEHKIKSPASCFATHHNLLAVGSWNANINLFSISDNGTYRSFANLHAHTGGITHLQFIPGGTKLVSGARKDHSLCVWDIRYHKKPLNILKRSVTTNQRIYFDISTCGKYLVSGGTDGVVRIWDDKITKWTQPFNVQSDNEGSPTYRFQLYRDCCNSVSIHPSRPIVATGSGQFHFMDPVKVLESESDRDSKFEGVPVQPQSAAHESSGEGTLIESEDGSSIEMCETERTNLFLVHEHVTENPPIEVDVENSAKEFIYEISDQDFEISVTESDTLVTSTESPLAKIPNCSDDNMKTSVCQVFDNGSVSIPTTNNIFVDTYCKISHHNDLIIADNLENMHVEIPTKLNEGETHNEENNGSQRQSDEVGEATSSGINDSLSPPIEACKMLITKPLDCDSNVSSGGKSNIQENNDVRSSSEPNRVETNGSPPPKPPETKRVIDSDLETYDDDYMKEKKMKYSSYAENNLTFWWTAKIFE